MAQVRVAFDVDYDETKMSDDDAAQYVYVMVNAGYKKVAEKANEPCECKVCDMFRNDARLAVSLIISEPTITQGPPTPSIN